MTDFNSTLHSSYNNNPFLSKASNPIHFTGNQTDMPKNINAKRDADNESWLVKLLSVEDDHSHSSNTTYDTGNIFSLLV